MSLFEDPKMEYYREWDRQYDAERARAEDARMLAYERKGSDALLFTYPSGETALQAVKKAVRESHDLTFGRKHFPDGTDCFEIMRDGKVIERHCIVPEHS